jgi:hypothetical protein
MKFRVILIFLALTSFSASNAFSWGGEGHEVVVRLAFRLMKPAERKAAYDLLGTHDYYEIGNWADEVKDLNGTKRWHFVDIPEKAEHYNADRDCPNGDCIIAALDKVRATIRDRSASQKDRRIALLYWLHLVGDLYQPFHCYAEGKGGNDIKVYFKGNQTSLHKLWDEKIIRYKHLSAWKLSSVIYNASHRTPSESTTFIEAAEKSHALAIKYKLENNDNVDAKYVQSAWQTINISLWKAACMASTIGPDIQ